MKDYINIGNSPAGEECAQVGSEGYYERTIAECKALINLLRRKFGKEPGTAKLITKSFSHDFGTYHEVVCWYDDVNKEELEYALKCEGKCPEYWDEQAIEYLKEKGVEVAEMERC